MSDDPSIKAAQREYEVVTRERKQMRAEMAAAQTGLRNRVIEAERERDQARERCTELVDERDAAKRARDEAMPMRGEIESMRDERNAQAKEAQRLRAENERLRAIVEAQDALIEAMEAKRRFDEPDAPIGSEYEVAWKSACEAEKVARERLAAAREQQQTSEKKDV